MEKCRRRRHFRCCMRRGCVARTRDKRELLSLCFEIVGRLFYVCAALLLGLNRSGLIWGYHKSCSKAPCRFLGLVGITYGCFRLEVKSIDGRVMELRVNCVNWSLSQSKVNPVPIMRCSHFTLYAESHLFKICGDILLFAKEKRIIYLWQWYIIFTHNILSLEKQCPDLLISKTTTKH